MVDQPYYQAETAPRCHPRTDLKERINQYGVRESDKYEARYDWDSADQWTHTEVEIGQWAVGPLLYIEEFDASGNTVFPTLCNCLCEAVVQGGYVPWGFRPETKQTEGGREHTGRWLWYLRPVEDITDEEDSPVYDTEFAIKTPEGEHEFLRNEDGNLVTFEDRGSAEVVADRVANDEVVGVSA